MLYLIYSLLFVFSTAATAQDWNWQQPLPQGNSLFGVHALSPSRVIFVGASGTVIATSDAGASWDVKSLVGGATGTLRSIHAINDNIWWVSGDSGALLMTSDAGENWTRRERPPTDNSLHAVTFADSAHGWAVGDSGTILRTVDGGGVWFQSPYLTRKNLRSVFFLNPARGWACGDSGLILHTTNGGTSWVSDASRTDNDLFGISFMDADTGVVAGEGGIILRTSNGGITWMPPLFTPSVQAIHALKFLNAQFAYGIGLGTLLVSRDAGVIWRNTLVDSRTAFHTIAFTDTSTGWIGGNTGDIRQSTTGGRSWNRISRGVGLELLDIAALDGQNCVAVGAEGTILRTTNGGNQWTSPAIVPTRRTLFAVHFPSPQSGWAVGDRGTILHTTDAGFSLATQSAPTTAPLFALQFLDGTQGWAGGQGILLSTTDGGAVWSRFPFVDSTKIISGIHFFTPNTGIVVASSSSPQDTGGVYRTTNGGATWDRDEGTSNIRTLYFINELLGWAGGVGRTLLKTTNGGISWVGQSIRIGSGYSSIFFADSANGWLVGRGGLLLRTTNGGSSWRILPAPSNNFINKLGFSDPTAGWAVGVNGTILKTLTGGGTGRELESPPPPPIPPVEEETDSIIVYPSFPNPFNQGTWIPYELLRTEESFELTIYDILGKTVKVFTVREMPRGRYLSSTSALYWDSRSGDGMLVPSGVYFYQLRSARETITRKLLLIR